MRLTLPDFKTYYNTVIKTNMHQQKHRSKLMVQKRIYK